jgi:inhibitor of KinA sporulation pathway (predicted exonuclease)
MEFEGTPHRGKDDSENVARILKQILKECGG